MTTDSREAARARTVNGEVAVLTGANGGIGRPLARLLASEGWSLILVLRDPSKAADLIEDLGPSVLGTISADLSDHLSIATAATEITERAPAIGLLLHGAGVQLGPRANSTHGIEMHFEVNALAPYQLTRQLSDPLSTGKGTVLAIGSRAMLHTRGLEVDRLPDPTDVRPLFGAYTQSKLALAAIMSGLAPSLAERDVVVRLCCPGPAKTPATTGAGMPGFLKPIRAVAFQPPQKAAEKVMAALDPGFGSETGLYIQDRKAHKLPEQALDPAVQRQVLALCSELTGV